MIKNYDNLKVRYGKETFTFNGVTFFGDERTFTLPEPEVCFDFKSIDIGTRVIQESEMTDSAFSIYYPVMQKAIDYCIEDYLMGNPSNDWEGFAEWLSENEENVYPDPLELHEF